MGDLSGWCVIIPRPARWGKLLRERRPRSLAQPIGHEALGEQRLPPGPAEVRITALSALPLSRPPLRGSLPLP